MILNPSLCAFLREKNALSWLSHYSGSARDCRRLLNFSEFISNFIHMVIHTLFKGVVIERCNILQASNETSKVYVRKERVGEELVEEIWSCVHGCSDS